MVNAFLPVDNLEIRLTDGDSAFWGKVEVKYNGQWGTVCDDKFDMMDANVICRMIGAPSAVHITSAGPVRDLDQPIWLDDLLCTGNETTLLECLHAGFGNNNCKHNEDVLVVCNEPGTVL